MKDLKVDFTLINQMNTLTKFFVSFDGYGNPVTVNYRGDDTYKTCLGALCTLIVKSFLLVFLGTALLELASYKDPQISQYTIYDPRVSGDEVNIGKSLGTMIFELYDDNYLSVKPDPRMFSYEFE